MFEFLNRLLPVSLPSVDIGREQKNKRLVWQCALGNCKFASGIVILAVAPVTVLREGKMRLARISSNAQQCLQWLVDLRQSGRGVVEPVRVKDIVSASELIMRPE